MSFEFLERVVACRIGVLSAEHGQGLVHPFLAPETNALPFTNCCSLPGFQICDPPAAPPSANVGITLVSLIPDGPLRPRSAD